MVAHSGRATQTPRTQTPARTLVALDLAVVVLGTGLALALWVVYGRHGGPSMLRPLVGFLLVFFFPGYAITAALFPRAHSDDSRETRRVSATVSGVERVVLAVGLSVVVVPLSSLALTLLSVSIEPQSVLATLCGVTLVATLLAALRRYRCRPADRFHVPVGGYATAGVRYLTATPLNLVLVAVIALGVGGLSAALVTTTPSERYTEAALLTDEETLTADDPTVELAANESATVTLQLTNRERRTVEYAVVVVRQELSSDGTVRGSTELDRLQVALADGERTRLDHEIAPPATDGRFRVTYLVYVGDVPDDPGRASAYRSVTVPVTGTS